MNQMDKRLPSSHLWSSSSSKSALGEVEDRGSSTGEPVAPECERHVYKSVLEGGDIPLQGLRALNKRHGSSSSSKGRTPTAFIDICRMWARGRAHGGMWRSEKAAALR